MIAALPDVETSPVSKRTKSFKDLTVNVDGSLAKMLATELPITGVRSDTAEKHEELRNIIAVWIDQGLRDKDALFYVNKDLVEETTNSRQRKRLFEILNKSGFFEIKIGYVPGIRCNARSFLNAPLNQLRVYPHNGSSSSPAPCLRWAFSGATVPFFLDGVWRSGYHRLIREGSERLWSGSFLFERLILDAMRSLFVLPVSDDELSDIICERESKQGRQRGKRKCQLTHDQKVEFYRERWASFDPDSSVEIVRHHGRCYHSLTNQPKELRRRKLLIPCKEGQLSRVVEYDMSGTYPVCLAGMALRRFGLTDSVARLIEDVQSGDIYRRIGQEIGGAHANRSHQQLKKDVSIGLFDESRRFGSTPVTHAFFRLYRDPANLVASIRNRPYGVRQLSNKLNEMEGRFFIDIVLPALHQRGIVCLPVHDAMMLAEPDGLEAAELMERLSVDYFGFKPTFKWAEL
jgi:hypothetical protein